MKHESVVALLASLGLLACGGGKVSVPENYRPPANPVFSPTAPAPPVQQQRPPPPPAPPALAAPAAPPPGQQPLGGSAAGFDQLGTEGPRGQGPAPTSPQGESGPEAQPEGGRQRLR